MAMVMMPQMTKFMKQNIILKNLRQTDNIKIEIYIGFGRAAAPVAGIMFYSYPIVYEAIP